jgi:hypothetical protein
MKTSQHRQREKAEKSKAAAAIKHGLAMKEKYQHRKR